MYWCLCALHGWSSLVMVINISDLNHGDLNWSYDLSFKDLSCAGYFVCKKSITNMYAIRKSSSHCGICAFYVLVWNTNLISLSGSVQNRQKCNAHIIRPVKIPAAAALNGSTQPNQVVVLVVQRFGVGLVIERSLVRLPTGCYQVN